MKSPVQRWLLSIAVMLPLLVLCSFIGAKVDGGPPFLTAAAAYILMLCCVGEWLVGQHLKMSLAIAVGVGAGIGGVIGIGTWLAMMAVVPAFVDIGDRFAFFVVSFLPFAFGVGVIGGGLARVAGCWLRRSGMNVEAGREVNAGKD